MRRNGHDPARVATLPTPGRRASDAHQASRVAVLAAATAIAVVLAGGQDAFWLCLPAALLACASSRTRRGTALSAATVTASAAAPSVVSAHLGPLPTWWLVLLVPAASVIVLVALRERLEREREALRGFGLSDPLTGLANRRLLFAQADHELARHRRARRSFALVMIDLDGFKLLNDRFGHASGDDLLRDVARSLERSMRAQDTVARLGGDEFCVLAPETDDPGTERLQDRVTNAVSAVTAGVQSVHASVGIAVFPGDAVTVAALMQVADQRLMSTKREQQRRRARRRAA